MKKLLLLAAVIGIVSAVVKMMVVEREANRG